MERILIVRLGAMGDVIHALPAAARLRAQYPHAQIDWAIEPRWQGLISSELANVVPVDSKSWRRRWADRSTWADIRRTRRELRDRHYDAVLDFQGAIKSAVIASWSRSLRIFGFADPREAPARWFYTHRQRRTTAHVIDHNLELAAELVPSAPLGSRAALPELLPRVPADELWAERFAGAKFALLTPAAGWAAKEWPADRYGELATRFAQAGLASLVNIGPGAREAALATAVEQASGGSAQRVQCSIGQLIALTRRASLFVGGDTGPMHLANALGVPVVAIFGPTDPARNGPYYNPHAVLRSPLSKVSYSHADRPDPGLLGITVDQVATAARDLLDRRT